MSVASLVASTSRTHGRTRQGSRSANPIFTWVASCTAGARAYPHDPVPDGVLLVAGMTATVQIDPRPAPAPLWLLRRAPPAPRSWKFPLARNRAGHSGQRARADAPSASTAQEGRIERRATLCANYMDGRKAAIISSSIRAPGVDNWFMQMVVLAGVQDPKYSLTRTPFHPDPECRSDIS